MRKLILVAMLFAALASCKKSSSDSPSLNSNTSIVGTWTSVSSTDYGYDAAGKVTYSVESRKFNYVFKSDGSAIVTTPDNSIVTNTTYTVTTTNGKSYLKISNTTDQTEISALTDHNMTLLTTYMVQVPFDASTVKIVTENKLTR